MAFGGIIGTAVRRGGAGRWLAPALPRRTLRRTAARPLPASRPDACPELDCVRALLPPAIVAGAERRALSIGLGADRVLICADAITEEAYLTALASSLGTIYEPLDRFHRADCPLSDHQLIQAAATGLLPLNVNGRGIWIVAPQCQAARRLADPHHPARHALHSFRLTSSERLWRFAARNMGDALGHQAADGLRRGQPLLSNALRPRSWAGTAIVLAIFAVVALLTVLDPPAAIKISTSLLAAVFLAAATLRLLSVLYSPLSPRRSRRLEDIELPIYTIICALYREERVVGNLVAAIRALDYPGIMAQTPQATERGPY